MNTAIKSVSILLAAGLTMSLYQNASAADVDVKANGAYTGKKVFLRIYEDINGAPILSSGVKVAYDPAKLKVVKSTKDVTTWAIGEGTNKGNPDPANNGADVVMIAGKVASANPTAGVTGKNKLIGTVEFDRLDGTTVPVKPAAGQTLATYFGLNLSLGKGGNFANFVTVPTTGGGGGVNLDQTGVSFGAPCLLLGDVNLDGAVGVKDLAILKSVYNTPDASADLDGVGGVGVKDLAILKAYYNSKCVL